MKITATTEHFLADVVNLNVSFYMGEKFLFSLDFFGEELNYCVNNVLKGLEAVYNSKETAVETEA